MAQKPTRKLSRPEKVDANRRAVFRAAAQVVGKHGYAAASIGRIMSRCGLAQGSFYIYFKSRQDLFDQLLPAIGEELLAHVGKAVRGSRDFFEVEERGLAAFFDYLTRNRGFFRILYETDQVSPEASGRHYELIVRKYVAVLERARAEHQLRPMDDTERDVLIYLMMAARDYLYRKVVLPRGLDEEGRRRIVEAYIRILRHGVAAPPESGTAPAED